MFLKIVLPYIFLLLITSNTWANCFDKTKSFKQNFESCSHAAERNDPNAQFYLGQMYRKGDGTARDLEKAIHWYRAAAEQGNIPAQYNLGWMYDTGNGVTKDESEAIKWYRQAAEQGDKYAAFNLGSIYYSKGNEPGNLIEVYFWFGVADFNGNTKAQKWQNKIVERMSSEQQQQAIKRLQQWKSRQSENAES